MNKLISRRFFGNLIRAGDAIRILAGWLYLLAAPLEPHQDWSNAGLAVHQADLLPELGVLEHALLVQLYPLL